MMNQGKLKGHLLTLAVNTLFAIDMPASKYLLPERVQPEALISMWMSLVCVMSWVTSLFIPYEKVPLKDLGFLCLCALCGVGLNRGLFIQGLSTTLPVDASIIATVAPIFVMISAVLILKEPITRMKTFGVLPGICGVISLMLQSAQGSNQASSLGGNLSIMVSGFMCSVYLVASKPLILKYSSVMMMEWMFLSFMLITLPSVIKSIWNTPAFHKEAFDGQELGAIFFVLFRAMFIPCLLMPLALKWIRPTAVSMYNYIQLIVASFIVVCIGQDSFSITKLVLAALAFSGVYLVTQGKSRADLEQQDSQSLDKNVRNTKNNA